MPVRPDPPDDAPPPAAPEPKLAPIVSLAEVRRRRLAPPAPLCQDHLQHQALSAAVRSGRLGTADLFAMVRLGILTDDVGMLPCADPHRRANALDWERRYLDAQGQAPPDQPSPSQVGCPLMAQAASPAAAPACIEALRQQAQIPGWRPDGGFARRPLDPEDPVVQSELRPCLLLSRELFRHLLLPLWQEEPK